MAIAKKQRSEPTCPLWMATYGDMVTNVLVFFVLLVSMSEMKKDDVFMDFMQAIQEAFGYVGGLNQVPFEDTLETKNVPLSQLLIVPIDPQDLGKSPDQGVVGRQERVESMRRADRYDQSGIFYFAELSAEILPQTEDKIARYVEKQRGHRTQIEVRGHCSQFPTDGTPYTDHFDLSYARAKAVRDALVRYGIEPTRLLVVAVGTNEPVTTHNYTEADRQGNDIVGVLQINRRVEEYGEATIEAPAE